MMIDPQVALAGLFVGFVVGLTGMGGGALMTPILVLLFKIQPLAAVSSDIVASMIMKPVGGGVHWRRGTVNTELVRWVLREHAVTLDGPDPSTLVDPVTTEQLRAEARAMADEYVAWAHQEPTSRWKQPYLVTTFCRILHTLETGRLVSKQAALEWARGELPNEWRDLVQRALDERPDPWRRVHEPADEAIVAETLAFADWVVSRTRLSTR